MIVRARVPAMNTKETPDLAVAENCQIWGVAFMSVVVCVVASGTSAHAVWKSDAPPKPAWTSTASHVDYPAPRYVLGVGLAKAAKDQAKDRLAADQNAFAEIVRHIASDVSSEITIQTVETQSGRIETCFERSASGTKVRSSLSVSGLVVADRYYDPKDRMYYSLGVLDRKIAIAPYLQQRDQIQGAYQAAKIASSTFEAQGHVVQAILSLRDAYRAACQCQDVLPLLLLVAGTAKAELGLASNAEVPEPATVLAHLSTILAGMRMEIVSGAGQCYIDNRPLRHPLMVCVTSGGDSRRPAPEVPVEFRFHSGGGHVLPMLAATDVHGCVKAAVNRVNTSSTERSGVLASVHFHQLLDAGTYSSAWNSRIPTTPLSTVFEFRRMRAPPGTEVVVQFGRCPATENRPTMALDILASRLSEMGFMTAASTKVGWMNRPGMTTLAGSAPVSQPNVIRITCDIASESFNDAMGMKVCNISGSAEAVLATDEKSLVRHAFDRVRGFGVREANAREDAYKNVGMELANHLIEELLVWAESVTQE